MTLCKECEFWSRDPRMPHYCRRITGDSVEAHIGDKWPDKAVLLFTEPEFGCTLGQPVAAGRYADPLTDEKKTAGA